MKSVFQEETRRTRKNGMSRQRRRVAKSVSGARSKWEGEESEVVLKEEVRH